jgi:hypothetical protein
MTARRFLTLALLLLGASWSAASACNGRGSAVSFRAAHPTVEPTLPLVLEMRLEGVERTDAESRVRLIVVVTADRDIRDLELELPAASGGEKLDTLELPVQPIDLAAGSSRTFTIPVRAPGGRDLKLRLNASFRTREGQVLHQGQGVTLKARPGQAGRSHLGAWEVMAVPLEAVHP